MSSAVGATAPAAHYPILNIIFRGNDIDGWMSAYLLAKMCPDFSIKFFPACPQKPAEWPTREELGDNITYVLAMRAAPDYDRTPVFMEIPNTTFSATYQVYYMFFPHFSPPEWVSLVNRITNWSKPTIEDKALREVLHPIACMPLNNSVSEAISRTDRFISNSFLPEKRQELIGKGKDILAMKDEMLGNVFTRGRILTLDDSQVRAWNLPESWLGRTVFLLNNTGIVIDSSLASSKVFSENPGVDIFINYRAFETVNPQSGNISVEYVFNARARNTADTGINLTENGIFTGHPCSAGARYKSSLECVVPFIS